MFRQIGQLVVLSSLLFVGCGNQAPERSPTESPTPILPTQAPVSAPDAKSETVLLFVKIPDPVNPIERGRKYEDPIDAVMRKAGLGEVSGGGSQLDSDGSILWIGVDVDVFDAKVALPVLKAALLDLGVPPGTEIEESTDGDPIVHKVR